MGVCRQVAFRREPGSRVKSQTFMAPLIRTGTTEDVRDQLATLLAEAAGGTHAKWREMIDVVRVPSSSSGHREAGVRDVQSRRDVGEDFGGRV